MKMELYLEKVERYASGQMNTAERQAFETELAENAELKQAYAVYRLGDEVIEQGIENDLRRQLKSWAAESGAPRARVVSMRPVWLRWAAAASVVLVAGFLFFRYNAGQYSDAALFAGQYEQPTASMFRAIDGAVNPFEKGYQAVESSRWAEATAFFEAIPDTDSRYAEAQYWLGHAALQSKEYDRALTAFRNTAALRDIKFSERAEWDLVLTYLAAGRSDAADFKTNLDRIANNPNHSFYSKAQTLQQKLHSFFRR